MGINYSQADRLISAIEPSTVDPTEGMSAEAVALVAIARALLAVVDALESA
jgi:hypothetical protein